MSRLVSPDSKLLSDSLCRRTTGQSSSGATNRAAQADQQVYTDEPHATSAPYAAASTGGTHACAALEQPQGLAAAGSFGRQRTSSPALSHRSNSTDAMGGVEGGSLNAGLLGTSSSANFMRQMLRRAVDGRSSPGAGVQGATSSHVTQEQGGQQVSKQAISERLGLSGAHDWLGLQAGKKAWLGKPASQAAQYYGHPSAASFLRKIGIKLSLRLTANSQWLTLLKRGKQGIDYI